MPGDKTNITKLVTSLCTNTNWVENTMRRLNDILPVKIDLKEVRGEGAGHVKRGPGIRSSKSQGPDPRNNLSCSRKSKSDGLEPS